MLRAQAAVAGEPVLDAATIWRNGAPRGDGADGDVRLGTRDHIDALECNGELRILRKRADHVVRPDHSSDPRSVVATLFTL